jgi:hypothetical protein
MNNGRSIPGKLEGVRRDISKYLWHFVGRAKSEQSFESILSSRTIKGSVDRDTGSTVICFSETPLSEHIRQDKTLHDSAYARLSLYGFGFEKSLLYAKGCLPVIYQPRVLLDELPAKFRHRHVDLRLDGDRPVDYSWQREWRLEAPELEFTPQEVILVVDNLRPFRDWLWDIEVDYEYEGGGEYSMNGGLVKQWDFIPLRHVEIESDKDITVCKTEDYTELWTDYSDWEADIAALPMSPHIDEEE